MRNSAHLLDSPIPPVYDTLCVETDTLSEERSRCRTKLAKSSGYCAGEGRGRCSRSGWQDRRSLRWL